MLSRQGTFLKNHFWQPPQQKAGSCRQQQGEIICVPGGKSGPSRPERLQLLLQKESSEAAGRATQAVEKK
jgi:hypothetical protein